MTEETTDSGRPFEPLDSLSSFNQIKAIPVEMRQEVVDFLRSKLPEIHAAADIDFF